MSNVRGYFSILLVIVLVAVMLPTTDVKIIQAQDEDGCGDADLDWINEILKDSAELDVSRLSREYLKEVWGDDLGEIEGLTDEPEPSGLLIKLYFLGDVSLNLPPAFANLSGLCFAVKEITEDDRINPFNGVDMYTGAGTEHEIVGLFDIEDFAVILGRNAVGDWLLVQANGVTAWVQTEALLFNCDLESLPIVEDEESPNTKQSFYFQSTPSDTCSEDSHGMLAYYPEADEPARIAINGYEITLSGSVFISTPTEDTMTLQKLDGQASIFSSVLEETALTDSLFTVNLDPIPFDSEILPLNQPDNDPALGLVLQTLFSEPSALATVDTLSDEPDDVFACDSETLADDFKVDINQAAITWFFNGDFYVDVQMGAPLEDDFSFGLNTFFLDEDNNPIIVFQWWRHDSEIGEDAWIWDALEEDFVALSGVTKAYDFETGILHFEMNNSAIELRADFEPPTIAGVAFESSHTPTSDTQPQPTTCDNSYATISPREFRITRFR